MILIGWCFVNVVGPLLLPVIGILPLRLLPMKVDPTDLRIMTTVKDGQLCWAVIAMATSTIYDLWEALETRGRVPDWGGLALAGAITIMLPAMLVAAGGAVFNTPLRTTATGGAWRWISHYRVFVASAVMTALTAFIHASVHSALSD